MHVPARQGRCTDPSHLHTDSCWVTPSIAFTTGSLLAKHSFEVTSPGGHFATVYDLHVHILVILGQNPER